MNYWYFDHSDFYFANGKLLLRGANGSGKSVTTASLFPVLLDGNNNAHRLDPLGSSAGQIEDYLLGKKRYPISRIEQVIFLQNTSNPIRKGILQQEPG